MNDMQAAHVLLWLVLSSNGHVASGSAQFENLAACNLGQLALVQLGNDIAKREKGPAPIIESECVAKKH